MARILVMDDDATLAAMIERTLKSAGHEVVLAVDGDEGIKQYRAAPADLVITDLFMPNREGLETIIELRKDFPAVRIIAMSGHTTAHNMLRAALRLGAVSVLEKPFRSQELLTAVEKALGSKS